MSNVSTGRRKNQGYHIYLVICSFFPSKVLFVMTAVTFPLRPPRLAFAICGWRWQNDVREIKYSVCVCGKAINE